MGPFDWNSNQNLPQLPPFSLYVKSGLTTHYDSFGFDLRKWTKELLDYLHVYTWDESCQGPFNPDYSFLISDDYGNCMITGTDGKLFVGCASGDTATGYFAFHLNHMFSVYPNEPLIISPSFEGHGDVAGLVIPGTDPTTLLVYNYNGDGVSIATSGCTWIFNDDCNLIIPGGIYFPDGSYISSATGIGQVSITDGTTTVSAVTLINFSGATIAGTSPSGTVTIIPGVTSVGMTVPSAFTVTPSSITTAGTFAISAVGTTTDYIDGTGAIQPFPIIPSGTVTHVGMTGSSAFAITGAPITGFGTINISGAGSTSQYIAGDGTLAYISALPFSTISATTGSVFFSGGGTVVSEDNANFFWDNSNDRLGLGTSSPQRRLHSTLSSVGTTTAIALENTNTTNNNGNVLSFRSATTGVGATSFFEFGAVRGTYEEHDHATSKGRISLWTNNLGTIQESFIATYDGQIKAPYLTSASTSNVLYYDTATGLITYDAAGSGSGTVTSVAISGSSAFAIGGSPITTSGTIVISGAGTSAQYIDGTGALQSFPSLTGYVPYTGATADVDLGVYGMLLDKLSFNTTATQTLSAAGQMLWNDSDGTLDIRLKGNNVTLQVGQESVLRVVNKTGGNLLEADYQVVRVRSVSEGGASGQRLAVVLAQGNNDPNSATTIGIVTETILVNQEGFITTSGNVREINTTGSLQGETWVDGDMLYLSPTTAGALTNIKPQAPNHTVVVGYVVYAHAIHGSIYVKVDNGYELDELHNVLISGVTNNDILAYDSVAGVWENKQISGVLGYTPVPDTRTLTINGTAYDLSADRSWTVGGSGTVTSVALSGSSAFAITGSPITTSGTITISGTGTSDQYIDGTGSLQSFPSITKFSSNRPVATTASVTTYGAWYKQFWPSTAATTNTALNQNQLWLMPVQLPAGLVINEIAFTIPTAGSAGALVSVGIYSSTVSSGEIRADALLSNFGSVSTSTNGKKVITSINYTVPSGTTDWFWIALVGTVAAPGNISFISSAVKQYIGFTTAGGTQYSAWTLTGQTSFPATISLATWLTGSDSASLIQIGYK